MNSSVEQLAQDVLALPEEDRKGIFLRLAHSLPAETSHLAESSRRAEEMRSGKVTPMSEETFRAKMMHLRITGMICARRHFSLGESHREI